MKKIYMQPATTMLVANLQTRLMAASGKASWVNGGGSNGDSNSESGNSNASGNANEFEGTSAKHNAWDSWEE